MRKIKKRFLVKEEAKRFSTLNIISAMMLIGLLALFLVSIGYSINDLVLASEKTEYIFSLLHRIAVTIILLIPFILKRCFGIHFPVLVVISFYVFIFLSVYIGAFTNLYEFTSLYNKFVHGFSGVALGFVSMFFIRSFNKSSNISPKLIFLFALIFSIALTTCWEVFEFIFDAIFNTNMQSYLNNVGKDALYYFSFLRFTEA